MESTIYFESKRGNGYLYDMQNSSMVNCHPIVEELMKLPSDKNRSNIYGFLQEKFPSVPIEEIKFYYRKYNYLKENGFFKCVDLKKYLAGRISDAIVVQQLANVNNVVFQVTHQCNLNCVYCCYGDLYDHADMNTRNNSMSFEQAKKVIDYLVDCWNSDLNLSQGGNIMFGFYGGEPLVNFELIEQIVKYAKTFQLKNHLTFYLV